MRSQVQCRRNIKRLTMCQGYFQAEPNETRQRRHAPDLVRTCACRSSGRTGLTTEECAQLRRLRKEVRTLRTEREILNNPLRSACAGASGPSGRRSSSVPRPALACREKAAAGSGPAAAFSVHRNGNLKSDPPLLRSSGRGRTEPSDGRPRPDECYCRGHLLWRAGCLVACGGLEPVAVAGDRQHGGVVETRLVGARESIRPEVHIS